MRAIYILVLLLLLSFVGLAQVTVTNPTNTTPNLAATYTSLSNAITALNTITSISGPVTITLNPGNPQTTPAGGYLILFSASATAANSITIDGSNNTITAFTPQFAGSLNDGIFTIFGCDYVTIQNFTMLENPANTTTTAAGNNMTEFGVALFHSSATDGAQHNTIQNNTISLSLNYSNSFGIYSTTRTAYSAVTGISDISNVSGSNLGNKIYSNIISNVNYGIVFIGSATAAYMDDGNDIGGSSPATGNTITNWGISAAASGYTNLTGSNYAIFMNHQVNDNVSYNTITGANHTTANTIGGILKNYTVTAPTGTNTSTISYNTITVTSSNGTAFMQVIQSASIGAAPSTTVNITNNTIQNCAVTGITTTAQFVGILNSWAPAVLNISNNILKGNSSTATNAIFQGITNSGAVTTTVNINNNQLGVAGVGLVTCSNANAQAYNCILNSAGAATATININYNSIDGVSVVTTGAFSGIVNTATSPATVNMNYNQLGSVTGTMITFSGAQSNIFTGINSSAGATTGSSSVQYNDVRGIVHIATATNIEYYVYTNRAVKIATVSNNTFTNISTKTSGAVYLIFRGGDMTNGQSYTCNNNSIVTAFSKTASSGTFYGFSSQRYSANGSTMTATGNNFSNITVSAFSVIYGWDDEEGDNTTHTGPTKTISNNTFNNWTTTSNDIYCIYFANSTGATVTNNVISNLNAPGGDVYGIFESKDAGSTVDVSYNTIYNLASSGGITCGIEGGSFNLSVWNIHHNTIYNLSSTCSTPIVLGITIDYGITTNIYNNLIHDLSQSADSFSPTIVGIDIVGGTSAPGKTFNVYNNIIYTLNATGINDPSHVVVEGIYSIWGDVNNFYNNFISDLNAPHTNYYDAIRGIEVHSLQTSTYNLYYNSIYINASSTGASFGTTGIWHQAFLANTGVLIMTDNIVKNTSTANGAGKTVIYRRGSTDLLNYSTTTDYNLYYAGTPSATNLMFYDGTNSYQTLAAYQAAVSPRDAHSISVSPNFVSITDLHILGNNCTIDGKGTPIVGYTTDIDADVRDVSNPDMGADEFTAFNSGVLASSAGNKVCSNKAVVSTGTTYTDASCNLIAKVLPSGGSPVTGTINACVTIDPGAVMTFNASPYVQRHYDIEPAVSNITTTSATITLYFTDAEFVAYNAARASFPALPTAVLGNADLNISNVRVSQFHGTPTTTPSSPGNYTGNAGVGVLIVPSLVYWNATYSRWEVTVSVTGFSGFYLHTSLIFGGLPISLNYLNGIKQGDDHLLSWKVTCNTTPRATLILERSADARTFNSIYSITADALRCQQPFNYTDTQPLNGMNYYRLKMVDEDGKITYSNIIALLNAAKGFELMSVAPNPVTKGTFKLNATAAKTTKMELVISDMMGRVLQRQTVSMPAGYNSIDMNVTGLAAGTYNIYGTTADDRSKVIRFVKQ